MEVSTVMTLQSLLSSTCSSPGWWSGKGNLFPGALLGNSGTGDLALLKMWGCSRPFVPQGTPQGVGK